MLNRRHLITSAVSGLAYSWGVVPILAQTGYPNRPVRIVVPFAAGGGPDVLTRKIGPKFSEILGQPIVVENIVGAGGIVAAQNVARAMPDGYTVLLGASTHIVQKAMQPSVKFDPIKDFVHITRTTVNPQLLVVAADAPFKTVQELVAAVRSSPGKLNYASGGIGSAAHLCGAALEYAMQVQAVHVPYKGSVEIIPSILQGATQYGFPVAASAMAMIQQGRVRALATTGAERLSQFPNVPTLKEALGKDDLVLDSWGGIWAPAGTPPATVDTLFKAYQKVYEIADIVAFHNAAGSLVSLSRSPAEFTQFVSQEAVKYERLVRAINLVGN